MKEGTKVAVLAIVGIIGIPYGWWANAFALEHIWNWYIPPFAPVMTFKAALGASCVIWALFAGYFLTVKKKEDRDPWTDLIVAAILPWISLGGARIGLWLFFE